MSEMEDKLGAVLGNPQMMQQIMSMAQAMNSAQPQQAETVHEVPPPSSAGIDPVFLSKLAGVAGQGGIDQDQQTLLKALSPYLSCDRIRRLEKAMRAAKLARFASTFLSQGGLSMITGR